MALDFLILYEHVVREYESLILLSEELKRRGYTVEIRQLLDRKKLKYFTWKKPRVLVASNLYDNEGLNSHVYNNVGKLNKVVNLHWEQMLSDTQEAESWFNFNGNAKKCVQTCWGEATRERLIQNGVPPHNAPVTGAVMMDFLRPEFEGYYRDKADLCKQYGLDAKRPLCLYICFFGYDSMGEDDVRELSEMALTDFSEFARINRESMKDTLAWFDRYLSEHKDVQLVYRRHPSEWGSEPLKALEKKHKGFHVIFADSVKQWVRVADTICIWMSTAVAEVYFAGKNCHILRPGHIPHEFDPVIYKDARYVESYEELLWAANNKEPEFPIKADVIERYFDKSEVPSYIRMADLLEKVLKEEPQDRPFSEGYKPHFNLLKFCALLGVHLFSALRFDPIRLKKFAPGFAQFASRIYGYIQKAKISEREEEQLQKRIAPYVQKMGEQWAERTQK